MKTKELKKAFITFEKEEIEAIDTVIDLLNDVVCEIEECDSNKIKFDFEMYLEVEELRELIDTLNSFSDYGKDGFELD